MDYHQNARLTIYSRAELARTVLEHGVTLKLAAARFNVSAKSAAKWVRRYRELGQAGMGDRSSRPPRISAPLQMPVNPRNRPQPRNLRQTGHIEDKIIGILVMPHPV
jgi:transposase